MSGTHREAADPERASRGGILGAEPVWVDAHVHVFSPQMIAERGSYLSRDDRFAALYADPRARMATAEEVIAEMDRTSVALSVIFGFPFGDQGLCREVNDYVLEAVGAWPGRLAGLACVAPGKRGALAELARCLDVGMRGCGELAPGATTADIEEMAEVAGLLRERGLPLMLHANEPVGHGYPGKGAFGPEACVDCAAAYPGLKLVFAHLGGGTFLYEAMPELRRILADVYYDTSALPYLYDAGIYRAVEATAGARKLLFGSDYALLSPSRYRDGTRNACAGRARGCLRRQRAKGLHAMSHDAKHSRADSGHGARQSHDLRRLLEALVSGDLGLDDAVQRLRLLQVTQLGEFARLDMNRDLRKGVPEVIYAPRKRDGELEMIVRRFLADRGLALVSRLAPERAEMLRSVAHGGEGDL